MVTHVKTSTTLFYKFYYIHSFVIVQRNSFLIITLAGAVLKKMEENKGIVARFVIGRRCKCFQINFLVYIVQLNYS